MSDKDKLENAIRVLEGNYKSCVFRHKDELVPVTDIIALLKAQEHMGQNGEQYQCNRCKYYEGVHNTAGHAPCSFWNIGGVMWNDYCSRFHDFRIGGEA